MTVGSEEISGLLGRFERETRVSNGSIPTRLSTALSEKRRKIIDNLKGHGECLAKLKEKRDSFKLHRSKLETRHTAFKKEVLKDLANSVNDWFEDFSPKTFKRLPPEKGRWRAEV